MTTTVAPEVQAVLDGDHDDQLDALAEAIQYRKRALDPAEALRDLANMSGHLDEVADGYPPERAAAVGAKYWGDLRKDFLTHPSPIVQQYAKALGRRVLVECLRVPPDKLDEVAQVAP